LQILFYLLMVVEVIISILLIGVILLQRSKGSGAGMAFGQGVGESLFGAQVGNVLTRTTVILAVIFLVNTAVITYVSARLSRRARQVMVPDAPPGGAATEEAASSGGTGAPPSGTGGGDQPAPVTPGNAE
jgi:preprotein translocase subunit SecG